MTGRFMVEHLVRVHRAFDGDIVAALVLGTIGQRNVRLFYDEVVSKSEETLESLIARGAHLPYIRPCNAMSVNASTGIPRETVHRKIRGLVERGWVEQVGRDKLYITRQVAPAFAAFDIETVQRFDAAAAQLAATVERRRTRAARAPKTGAPGAIASAAGVPEPLAAAPPAARHR